MAQKSDRDRSNFPDLYDDLWDLRKKIRSPLAVAIGAYPRLVATLSDNRDHLEAAMKLTRLLSTFRHDREVRAFTLTLEGGAYGDRFFWAGEQLFLEQRRARSLSDAGLLKVAELIGGHSVVLKDMWLNFIAVANESHLSIIVQMGLIAGVGEGQVRTPMFVVDGEQVEAPPYEYRGDREAVEFDAFRFRTDVAPGEQVAMVGVAVGEHFGSQLYVRSADLGLLFSHAYRAGISILKVSRSPSEA